MTENDQNISTKSQEIQEILRKFPTWIMRFGSLLLLLCIVLTIIASAFLSFPMKEKGAVSILSLTAELELFSNQDGQIEQILVSKEELVAKGQILAVLKSEALSADMFLLISKLDSLIIAPQSKKSISFPGNLTLGEIQVVYNEFTKVLQASIQVQKQATKGVQNSKNKPLLQSSSARAVEIGYNAALQDLQLAIANWETKYLIRAPTAGYVQLNGDKIVQDNLKTNEVFGSIAQGNRQYEVFTELSPSSLQNLKANQEVQIILDSYNEEEYGAILGQISELPMPCTEPGCKLFIKLPNGLTDLKGKSFPYAKRYTGSILLVHANETVLFKAIHGLRSLIRVN
jgi:hypothetical protein